MAIPYDYDDGTGSSAGTGQVMPSTPSTPTDWAGIGNKVAGLFGSAADIYGYDSLKSDLKNDQSNAKLQLAEIMNNAGSAAEFKGYGVTSNVGSSQVDKAGNITMSLDPQIEAYGKQARDAGAGLMQQSAMDPTQREQGVTDEILAAMAGQRERDKIGLDSSLWNTGRGGVASGAYGGSPEQLAFFKALDEGNLNAAIAGKEFNLREQDSLYKRGSGMFNDSFIPNQQLREDLKFGVNTSQLTQDSRQAQADLIAELGLGGLLTDVNYNSIAAGLKQDEYAALGEAARGSGNLWGDASKKLYDIFLGDN